MFDREKQKRLLHELAEQYPNYVLPQTFAHMAERNRNVQYLIEHGLIRKIPSEKVADSRVRITCKGLDFLADDGGLSAILGVVTIKLHEETLLHLLEARIQTSDQLSPPDKQKWTDALRELPAESIKHLSMKLIDLALEQGTNAFPLLARYLAQ